MSITSPKKVLIAGGKPAGGVASFAEALRCGFTELGIPGRGGCALEYPAALWRVTRSSGFEDTEHLSGLCRAVFQTRLVHSAWLSLCCAPGLADDVRNSGLAQNGLRLPGNATGRRLGLFGVAPASNLRPARGRGNP